MLTALIGFISGILSGMGVGGGMILIPSLTLICHINQHSAQSVNLFFFIPTAVCAIIIHIKNKTIDKKAALSMICWGVPFSLLGAYLALKLSDKFLSRLFAGFIFIFGVSEIIKTQKTIKKDKKSKKTV